jgi:hypothetical protein
VRKFKIFFLATVVIGFFSMVGCTKKDTTTVYTRDSVYSSSWITLGMSFNGTDSDYEQTISAPAVTSSILSTGVVLGYGAYVNSANDTVEEAALEFDMYQTFSVGSILLQAGFDNSGLFYRYVVVPGSVLAATKVTPKELKSMSYTEVTKLLGTTTAKQAAPSTLTN